MADVEFSNAAEADLGEIDEFSVAQFGDDVAEIYMHGFDDAFALLRGYPMAGPAMPELGPDGGFSVVGVTTDPEAWTLIQGKAHGLIFSRMSPDLFFQPLGEKIKRYKANEVSPWLEKFT